MSRFFIDGLYEPGDFVRLTGADAHKITNVLRLRDGDHVELIDSGGNVFFAALEFGGRTVRALLQETVSRPSEPSLRITLAQGIPKGQKMDFVVEKATELGVMRIIPFVSERTIGQERGNHKRERWRRLAQAAAQQSGRAYIPFVESPLCWEALIDSFSTFDRVLLPWELAERRPLRTVLPNLLITACDVLVIIGPEGGISHTEADAALAAGACAISLGSRILRTETAGLIACAVLLYEQGEL
jgi:16S rRNA (uracil1498-N3)-methyltransferase